MLVIVLVTILFASAALVMFIEKASDDLVVDAREAAARRLRQEAYSALDVTLAVLTDFRMVNGGLHSVAEGWNDPLGFAGWEPREGCTAEVSFEDESGKLSLPHADSATLVNLFQGWGMSQVNAEHLADVLLAWMQKDHVTSSATPPDYDQGALPYTAPLRSLRSFSELSAIDYARDVFYDDNGRPNDLWARFVGAVSLYDFKQTNINGARGDVLGALGSLDITQQKQLAEYLDGTGSRAREGPAFFESTSEAANVIGTGVLPQGYGTQISALRINITIHEGRTAFHLSVVVTSPGGASAVQAVASTNSSNPSSSTSPAATPAASPAASANSAKKLNYPFTLLEIKENAEIAVVPAPSTKA